MVLRMSGETAVELWLESAGGRWKVRSFATLRMTAETYKRQQQRLVVGGSVGDLPAYWGLGEDGFCADLAGGGAGHLGEGRLDVVADGPDGDFLHGVFVGDGGFFEAVVDDDWSGAVDAGDLTVAVTEAGSVTGSRRGHGVAADADA